MTGCACCAVDKLVKVVTEGGHEVKAGEDSSCGGGAAEVLFVFLMLGQCKLYKALADNQ
jgi:hypothetical protein